MILLTGVSGQLGTAMLPLLADDDVVTADLAGVEGADQDLDLADQDALRALLDDVAPTVIVNAAAWTAVDAAEEHEDVATQVNGTAVATMADWAAAHGAWLLSLSTDYVFDGTGDEPLLEDHPTDPINAYGRSKVVGERAAVDSGAALVVRTSWLVSGTHDNFVATMLGLLDRGVDPKVVDDQVGCPTVAEDLAVALAGLVDDRPTGLLHLTNTGPTTWWGLACEAASLAGHDPERVSPCSSEEFPTAAARPTWSVLGSSRRDELGLAPMRAWQEALVDVVAGQQRR